MDTPTNFFYANAGFSYDPKTETADQGKTRCAKRLSVAEAAARDNGVSFEWRIDPEGADSAGEYSSSGPFWYCVAYDSEGTVIGSLGGVDFGKDGKPWGNNYRRVVEAELSYEHFHA